VNLTSNEGHYQITSNVLAANNFTLQATPLGVQTGDARCGSFTLTDTGVRDATGPDGVDCW
jgi:type IV pilus assembly protein PilE